MTWNSENECYYERHRLSNGQYCMVAFYRFYRSRSVEYHVVFAVADKKKALNGYFDQTKDNNISLKYTGRCGAEALIWCRDKLLEFENEVFLLETCETKIVVYGEDHRRFRFYERALTRYGYEKKLIDDGWATTKEGVGSLTAIERLIATAKAEEGYLEKATNAQLDSKTANAGSNNWTKYARDLDNIGNIYNGKKNGYAWCDVFVDWCFIKTFGVDLAMRLLCQPYGGAGAGCTYSVQYYKQKDQFHKSNPQAGDQIFFTNDGGKTSYHTGLVIAVGNGKVYTIEGNTSSAPGVVPNGGCVRTKSYNLTATYICGYGRPDWSLVGDSVEQEDEDMTLDRFKELMKEYRAELQDNDCGTWSKDAREWAIANGIISGTGNNANGEPNYAWADQLTREQAAALFYRFAKLMGKA